MNRILLLFFLMASGIINAQIVNIPDIGFKNYLLNYTFEQGQPLDANNDDEIQVSEAELVTEMYIPSNNTIQDFTGIQSFINLHTFWLQSQIGITTIDFSGLTNLYYVRVVNLQDLTSLNFAGCASLYEVQVLSNPNLSNLNLEGCSSLSILYCSYNHLSTLDISDCPLITSMDIDSNPLTFLNLKNGYISQIEQLTLDNYNMSICLDEGEEIYFEFFEAYNLQISTYCSFTPGGDYNTIAGTLTFDVNNNGCGTGDSFEDFVKVNINDGTTQGATFTNNSGQYNFYTQAGSFIITPQFENDWFVANPPSATVTLNEVDNAVTTQNFCVTANGIHPDVEVVIVPLGQAQPGFDAFYKVVFKNKGNQTLSGAVTFNYDESLIDFVEALPVQSTLAAGQLTWDYTGLLPFETRDVTITFNVNSPQETPAVNIDDVLAFTASVTPASADETPADNTFDFNQIVTGSFDPNDITCLEGASVTPDMIGEYLHYNINFENTGNAPATFIVVKDVIDEAQFDMSTLQVLNASHVMESKVEGNEVEFYFDAINLGPQEKGNVVFKIKTLNTLQVNDEVSQQANIFFDYNLPIETNEATTVFAALGTGDFKADASVKIYPNPSNSIVNITADDIISGYELYDIQGRLLQSGTVNEHTAQLDISQRAAGMYFIKVATKNGVKTEKIVKK